MFKCTRKDFLLIQNFHLAHYKKFHLLMPSYSREHFYLTANKNPCFVSSHSNITRSNIRSVYQKRFPIYPKCTIYANLLLYKKFHLFIECYNREHCYLAANKKKHCFISNAITASQSGSRQTLKLPFIRSEGSHELLNASFTHTLNDGITIFVCLLTQKMG